MTQFNHNYLYNCSNFKYSHNGELGLQYMNLKMRQNSAHNNYTHTHTHTHTLAKMKRTISIVGNWNSWYSHTRLLGF